MKSRPILFSGEMVRAILDGKKTQTRRICKARTQNQADIIGGAIIDDELCDLENIRYFEGKAWRDHIECPYGKPGDTLWVKESWKVTFADFDVRLKERIRVEGEYAAGGSFSELLTEDQSDKFHLWKRQIGGHPGIFMFPSISRITLEITGIRVQRLKDISEADAKAEGVNWKNYVYAAEAYQELWEEINGAGSWAENPFVWVIEFRKVEGGEA